MNVPSQTEQYNRGTLTCRHACAGSHPCDIQHHTAGGHGERIQDVRDGPEKRRKTRSFTESRMLGAVAITAQRQDKNRCVHRVQISNRHWLVLS